MSRLFIDPGVYERQKQFGKSWKDKMQDRYATMIRASFVRKKSLWHNGCKFFLCKTKDTSKKLSKVQKIIAKPWLSLDLSIKKHLDSSSRNSSKKNSGPFGGGNRIKSRNHYKNKIPVFFLICHVFTGLCHVQVWEDYRDLIFVVVSTCCPAPSAN